MKGFNDKYHKNKEPLYTDPEHDVDSAIQMFSIGYNTVSISNCLPRFLYAEINPQTDEKHYFFKVTFPNRKGQYLAGLSANDIDCPANMKTVSVIKSNRSQNQGNTFRSGMDAEKMV